MKCIQCGKQLIEKVEDGSVLCHQCFAKKHSCLGSFEEHTLFICQECGAYKWQKQWKPQKKIEEALKESLLHHCRFVLTPQIIKLDILIQNGGDKRQKRQKGTAFLRTETKIEQQVLKEEFELPVNITYTLCEQCSLLKTEYYEGVLQLRGENKATLEKAHNFVLEDAANAQHKGIFITKIEQTKNGFDYYYTKQQYLPVITNKLVERFGAAGKSHAELFGKSRETSKNLYRVNASVRLPLYEKGTVVKYKNKILQIYRVGKQVTATDLLTGKMLVIDEPKELKIIAMPDAFKKVHVTKTKPNIEVLHPETFQSVPVQNPGRKERKDEVTIAIIDDKVWIVE